MIKTVATKLGICFGVVLLVLMMDCSICYGKQTQMEDVVYLKNGSIIRGTIIEQVPGKKLKIETKDGNVFVYTLDEVERFTKEPARHSASSVGRKSGGAAFALSFLITGGGQFYNGEYLKSGLMLGANLLGFGLVLGSSVTESYRVWDSYEHEYNYEYRQVTDETTLVIGVVILVGSKIWSLIDAPISSARINRENDLASIYRISDNLYVDVKVSNIGSRSTPYLRAVLSF